MQPAKEELPLKAWRVHWDKVGLSFAGKKSLASLWMVEFGHFIACLWSGCTLIAVSPVSDAGHYDHISLVAGELCVLVRRACRFRQHLCPLACCNGTCDKSWRGKMGLGKPWNTYQSTEEQLILSYVLLSAFVSGCVDRELQKQKTNPA